MTDGKLQWHPGFIAALHIELGDEMDGSDRAGELGADGGGKEDV